MCTPGKRVSPKGTAGSNPAPSAIFVLASGAINEHLKKNFKTAHLVCCSAQCYMATCQLPIMAQYEVTLVRRSVGPTGAATKAEAAKPTPGETSVARSARNLIFVAAILEKKTGEREALAAAFGGCV